MKPATKNKYQAFPSIDIPDREWPSKTITQPPAWCSVDLRDGNQAIVTPMNIDQKMRMFHLLLKIGFKEIEIGFPSAAKVEYDFLRKLIDEKVVPDDVHVQVLTQAREHLINKTVESLKGAKNSIIHLYNSTSTLQREVVFKMDKKSIKDIAINGAKMVRDGVAKMGNQNVRLQYSPESFTGTELDYALEVCEAVLDIWQPSPENKIIINLPATVEMSTPNIYADQVEWFSKNISRRDSILLSAHCHNDRGTAVAATELAMMAGIDRVEGTLFGNGERTGNVDIVTLALNMFTQGVDPNLELQDINEIIEVFEDCNKLPVPPRHPYAGEFVYTAFSGSHQDAINKGFKAYEKSESKTWAVPYLPIDPKDVGRSYESIIRVNSQSGKGGVAYIMGSEFGYDLPKSMHPEFSKLVQSVCDAEGVELEPTRIYQIFEENYLNATSPIEFKQSYIESIPSVVDGTLTTETKVKATMIYKNQEVEVEGHGNGPINALSNGIKKALNIQFKLKEYKEHSMELGSSSKAVAYIQIDMDDQLPRFGVGIDTNISMASFKALCSAMNRSLNSQ